MSTKQERYVTKGTWMYWFSGLLARRIIRLRYSVIDTSDRAGYDIFIVVSNHQGRFDPWLVGAAVPVSKKIIHWFAKKETLDVELTKQDWSDTIKNPILQYILAPLSVFIVSHCGVIAVDREDPSNRINKRAFHTSFDILKKRSGSIGIFIEGGINLEEKRLYSSAVRLAQKHDVPILPISIKGKKIIIGEAFFVSSKSKDYNIETIRLRDIINNLHN